MCKSLWIALAFVGITVGKNCAQPPETRWTTPEELTHRSPASVTHLDLSDVRQLPPVFPRLNQLVALRVIAPELPRLSLANAPNLKRLELERTWALNHDSVLLSLAQPAALEVLSLRFCNLRALPTGLSNLVGLQELNLELNQLARLPVLPPAPLRVLRLGQNERLRGLPNTLGDITTLAVLELDQTPISQLPPSLTQLSMLQELHLGGTNLNSLPPGFAGLQALRGLSLNACDSLRWEVVFPQLAPLKLKRLNLAENDFRAIDSLRAFPTGLDSLVLANCAGVQRLLPLIAANSGLRILDLSRTRLGDSLGCLSSLPQLERLDLSALDLKRLPPEVLRLHRLRHLDLRYNDLPLAELQVLAQLPTLESLRISYGRFSDSDLQQLQAALPRVEILQE